MKSLIFVLCLFSKTAFAADYVIVSDLDDTIKVTDVQYPVHSAWNSLLRKKLFIGAPEYYSGVSKNADLQVLSGSPTFLRGKISRTLHFNGIDNFTLTLRKKGEGLFEFKLRALEAILQKTNLNFVLIGDDTQFDHHVYAEFQKRYPERVLAIYIRKITGKDLHPGEIGIFSSYEIAQNEAIAGRLDAETLGNVAEATLSSTRPFRLFPDFAICPKDTTEIALAGNLMPEVKQHLVDTCKVRNYTPRSQR